MWIAKIRARHDCIIGNRCRQFGVTTLGAPFNVFVEKGVTHSPQVQTIYGREEAVKGFIADLRKDKRVQNLEVEGNTVFLIEFRKEKIPATFYNPKLIYVKPVFVDKQGFEQWEVASWKKEILAEFINGLRGAIEEMRVLKIGQTRLTDIYFPHLGPKLSEQQKRALQLALELGYYEWPKRAGLGKMAKAMGVSVQTFREHLKKAEHKIMPDLARQIQ